MLAGASKSHGHGNADSAKVTRGKGTVTRVYAMVDIYARCEFTACAKGGVRCEYIDITRGKVRSSKMIGIVLVKVVDVLVLTIGVYATAGGAALNEPRGARSWREQRHRKLRMSSNTRRLATLIARTSP